MSSLLIFSFIIIMWILILFGGGLMTLFVGPLSLTGIVDSNSILASGLKVLIAMMFILIWIFLLLKIKNWIFRKSVNYE